MSIIHSTRRNVINSDMVGKTIRKIDNKCVNVLKIWFSDDTYLELWAEIYSSGIPVIEIDPNATKGN
jgi:hypothetical protein